MGSGTRGARRRPPDHLRAPAVGRRAVRPARDRPRGARRTPRTRWSSFASSASATSRPARGAWPPGGARAWRCRCSWSPTSSQRSLDAFPAEFGAILSATIACCTAPIRSTASSVDPTDLRRACEVEARGHLLHLREGFLECGGRPDAVSRLVDVSAPALRALLVNLTRLDGTPGTTPSAYATGELGPLHGRTIAVGALHARRARWPSRMQRADFRQYLAPPSRRWSTYVDHWACDRAPASSCLASAWLALVRLAASSAQPPPPAADRTRSTTSPASSTRQRARADRSVARASPRQPATCSSSPRSRRVSRGPTSQSYAVKMFENGGRGIGERQRQERQRRPDPARRGRPAGADRSGLRPRGVHHGRLLPARPAASDGARTSSRATTAAACWRARGQVAARLAEARGVKLPGLPAPRASAAVEAAADFLGG